MPVGEQIEDAGGGRSDRWFMKAIYIKLPSSLEKIKIYVVGDVHLGDPHCDKRRVSEIEEKLRDPEAFCVLGGDIINNATKGSVSDCYGEELSPMQQLTAMVEMIRPFKDKVLFAVDGNHEARSYKGDGIDLTRIALRELGIEDRYAPDGGVLFLSLGKNSNGKSKTNNPGEARQVAYTIYVTHGTGGGRREGGKANSLTDLASIVDADIYIHGHTHLPMVIREAFYRLDDRNKTVAKVDKLFVNGASSLNYGGYGQRFCFKPGSTKSPVIFLSGTKKEFEAIL